MKTLNPDLSLRQKEIVVGTVLGGSSLVKPVGGKNCYLSMRDRDAHWLEYKADSLKELASLAPFTLPKQGRTYRWHSMCYPVFADFYEMFYNRGKRKLRQDVLDPLRDWGLSVWFVDCGKYLDDCIVLNTNVWGRKGTKTIIDYLKSLGYVVQVKMERNGLRVQLDHESSVHFLEVITPPLPVFVRKACEER